MNSYIKPLLGITLLSCCILSSSYASNLPWLPNLVHYINNSEPLPSPSPELPIHAENFTDMATLTWPAFGGEQFIYKLEYQLAGTEQWVSLYQGTNTYYQASAILPSGSYIFRLNCDSGEGCSANGHIYTNVNIVQKPAYVNATFDYDTNNLDVYWGQIEEVVGYSVEQSVDNGASWQTIPPQAEEGLNYQGGDYTGTIHTSNNITLANTYIQQSIQSAKVKQNQALKVNDRHKKTITDRLTASKHLTNNVNHKSVRNNASNSNNSVNSALSIGATLQYRVKACSTQTCGQSQQSQPLTLVNLNGLIPDPSFEQGEVQFSEEVWSTVGSSLKITSQSALNGTNSLQINLSNYAYAYYVHNYQSIYNNDASQYPILNGLTLTSKMTIKSLSKDSKISVYPVAYYNGDNRRVEGQKQEFTKDNIGEVLNLKSQVWLDDKNEPENKIKRVYFLVRLIGEGSAEVILDDSQLYEGSGLAQTDPTLSAYINSYSGILKHSWSAFSAENATYHLEFREEQQQEWQEYYRGTATTFHNTEVSLPTGVYHFRMSCQGNANCPQSGYITATTVVAKEPAYLSVKTNAVNGTTVLDWADTVSSYGYIIEKSTDNGISWLELPPTLTEPSRAYSEAKGTYSGTLYTQSSKTINGVVNASDLFRVRACRSSRCGDFKISTGVYDYFAKPEKVPYFRVDNAAIKPGESVSLTWGRPLNYSGDFTYNIYVRKPNSDGYPAEQRSIWQSLLKVHTISRGGATGIQRVGRHYLDIEVCNAQGCSDRQTIDEELTLTVQGPPPKPWIFSSDKINITQGEPINLNWAMHHNYQETVSYRLSLEKPDGNTELLLNPSVEQALNPIMQLVNNPDMNGTHVYHLSACMVDTSTDESTCGMPAIITLHVGVMQDDSGNLYLTLQNQAFRVSQETGKWLVSEINQEQWHTLSLSVSDYSLNLGTDSAGGFSLIHSEGGANISFIYTNSGYQALNSPEGDVYVQVPDDLGGQYLKITKADSEWLVEELSQSQWDSEAQPNPDTGFNSQHLKLYQVEDTWHIEEITQLEWDELTQ